MNRFDFTVATLGDLVTLHIAELIDGTSVWVASDLAYWTLEKNSGATVNSTVLAPLSGSPIAGGSNARWIRGNGSSSIVRGFATTGAGGNVKVNTPYITANSLLFLSWNAGGGNTPTGIIFDYLRTPGVSFSVTSSQAGDVGCNFAWMLMEP